MAGQICCKAYISKINCLLTFGKEDCYIWLGTVPYLTSLIFLTDELFCNIL